MTDKKIFSEKTKNNAADISGKTIYLQGGKNMKKGNVLVIGNSGVGKSTLINAVLGEEFAETGWGIAGITKKLKLYENEEIPFRIIDTVGFEQNLFKQYKAVNDVKKWSKQSAKEGKSDNQINVIWFCIDGTARKLFPETINNLSHAISMWKSVPIIVAITKSYAIPDRKENIEMVHNAFAKQKCSRNLQKIIPVVASTYVLNDTAYAPPEGITELIDATNKLMPEGVKAAEKDIYAFKLNRKRVFSQSIVGAATTGGIITGAIPLPIADAAILSTIEATEINSIAKIYGINKDEKSKNFINTIIEVGTVSAVAKAAIGAIKAIPGINLAASVLNAIIAGSFVAIIGEASIYVFEQVYLGNKTVEDIDWVKNIIEAKLSSDLIEKVKIIIEKTTDKTDKNSLGEIINSLFNNKEDKK